MKKELTRIRGLLVEIRDALRAIHASLRSKVDKE